MPRPHTEFVQAQALPWTNDVEWLPSGVLQKLLSRDAGSGAVTTVLRYPPGYRVAKNLSLACDEELYVLDGSISIGDDEYTTGDYAYLPAGYVRRGMRSDGCDVLSFLESAPRGSDVNAACDESQLVRRLSTSAMPWGSASDKKVAAANVGRKVLRPDTAIGERTWILSLQVENGQRYPLNGVEEHPCVEEMFLLAGDIAMVTGTLRQGAYFWRPPHIKHGPMGTSTGFVALFRAKEGAFETEWSEPTTGIPWDASYTPELPAEMQQRLIGSPELSVPY